MGKNNQTAAPAADTAATDTNTGSTETVALTTDVVESLTTSDVAALTTDQVAALTTSDVSSIPTSQVDSLGAAALNEGAPMIDAPAVTLPPAVEGEPAVLGETSAVQDKAFAEGTPTQEPGSTTTPASPEAAAAVTPITPPAPKATPTAPAAKTTVVIETDPRATGVPRAIIDSVLGKVSAGAKNHLNSLGDYMEAMKPRRPVQTVDGGRHQVGLYRTILGIINGTEEDFNVVFGTLLRLFAEHDKGVFAETHVFRYFESMPLNDADRKAFQRLLNMLKVLAPVKGREIAIKQVDLGHTLAHTAITEAGRQRVMSFFNK